MYWSVTSVRRVDRIILSEGSEGLFCKLGQQASLIDIENIDENVLINRVDALISSLPQVRHQLFTGVEQERLSAWQTSNLVRQAFKQWQIDHQ